MAVSQTPAPPPPGLDSAAAAAVSNSAALPPPAPVPPSTAQNLAVPPPAPNMPALPPLPQPDAGAPATLPALDAAPAVTMPATPATTENLPSLALPPVPQAEAPAVVVPTPVVSMPTAETINGVPNPNASPLMSTSSDGPLLPIVPDQEILASQQLPMPALTPESPLIPARSLAETMNQNRQVTTLPGSGGDTNYAYATIGGPAGPARPLITPPSIIDTVQGTDIGKDYPPLQAVMPRAEATPARWDSPSAFGTPTPPSALTYYMSKSMRRTPDKLQVNPSPINTEIIVLRGGQEFQGLVHERGSTLR